ncbi:hypothetical protein ACQJBY_053869 [Aegilops geniculata]
MGAKVAATALFFLLLTSAYGKKDTPCEGPSQTYHAVCTDPACDAACITEDYKGGYCSPGRLNTCLCTNKCHDQTLPPNRV